MTLKDWPASERPRERLLAHGPGALSEAELLAVFLRTGVRGRTVIEVARHALDHFGGLNGLLSAPQRELERLAGFGPAKCAQLHAVLELARRAVREEVRRDTVLNTPAKVREYLTLALRNERHEVFVALFLDAQNRLIADEPLFRGTLTQTSVFPCVPLVPGMHLSFKSLKPHEFPNLPANLGELLRKKRHALKLTIDHAARQLGVNVGTLGDWERGKEKPFPRMIPRILQFIGISIDEARQRVAA